MHFFTLLACSLLLTTTVIESVSFPERLHLSTLQRSSTFQKKKLALVDTVIVHLISSASSSSHSLTSASLSSSLASASSSSSQSPSSSSSVSAPSSVSSTLSSGSLDSSTLSSSSQCVDSKTYWDPINLQCTNCTVSCPTGGFISRQCNREHDTECQCPKGAYLSLPDGACKPCAQCPSGSGVWRTCRWSRNTVCRKCQPGTYSGVSVGTLGCIPCTKCTSNQEMIAECDGNRDTVCLDRNSFHSNYSLYFSSELTAAAAAKAQQDEEVDVDEKMLANQAQKPEPLFRWHSPDLRATPEDGSSYVLPVYFTCLVVIVFAGSIYAFVQFRCVTGHNQMRTVKMIDDRKYHQHHSAPIQPILHPTSSSIPAQHHLPPPAMAFIPHLYPAPFETHTDAQPVSYMHLYPSVPPTQWRLPVASREPENPPKLYQNRQNQYKAYYELLYAPYECEQSAPSTLTSSVASTVKNSILDELEHRLGNDLVSWEMLARDFGYDDQQIAVLEEQEDNRKNTVQTVSKLLHNWALKHMNDDSNKIDDCSRDDIERLLCDHDKSEQLACALVRIGRIDCARLLRSVAQKPSFSDDNCTVVQHSKEQILLID